MSADYRTQQQADALWRAIEANVDKRIAEALARQSGVIPGGPYTSFTVRPNGLIDWAGAGGAGGYRAHFESSSSQSLASSGSTPALIQFDSVDFETGALGAVTTGSSWKYTHTSATTTIYLVSCKITIDLFAWVASSRCELRLCKNGTTSGENWLSSETGFGNGTNSYIREAKGATLIEMAQNDYIDIRLLQNTGSSRTLNGNPQENYIDIVSL